MNGKNLRDVLRFYGKTIKEPPINSSARLLCISDSHASKAYGSLLMPVLFL